MKTILARRPEPPTSTPNPDYRFLTPACPVCGGPAIALKEIVPVMARLTPEGDGYAYAGESECVWDEQVPELHQADNSTNPPTVTLQCAEGDQWESFIRCGGGACTAGLMPGESCDRCGAVCSQDTEEVDCERCGGTGEEPGVPIDDKDGMAVCCDCHGRGTVVATPADLDSLAEGRFENADTREQRLNAGWCPSCQHAKPDVDERYSFGVYAGILCGDCARTKYRDGCGLDGRQGNPADLSEPYDEN